MQLKKKIKKYLDFVFTHKLINTRVSTADIYNAQVVKSVTERHSRYGFTLVEVVITIAIIVLITGVLFGNFKQFTTNAEFDNLSTDIVLAIREAQVYGTSVREGTNEFNNAYGVHISKNPPRYIIFADDGDNIYSNTSSDSILSSTQFKSNFTIVDISTGPEGGPLLPGRNVLDIAFKRPSPDAVIQGVDSGGLPTGIVEYATVIIQNPDGKQKMIEIGSSGQVTVSNLPAI